MFSFFIHKINNALLVYLFTHKCEQTPEHHQTDEKHLKM